jgi:hypothetical protein
MSEPEDVVMERFEWLLKSMRPRVDLTQRRSDELIADISRWRKPDPIRSSLVVKEAPECGWYIQLDSVDPPPAIEHWGMQIAEIAHHLRSILNTTLTRIVIADGGTPSKALQYPIALTAKSWRQQAGRIKGLPERVQRAIYACQPFVWARNSGTLAENHVLAVLAWVDNEDKHRLELQGTLAPSWIEHEARIIDSDGVARRVEPKLTFDWSLTPGSRIVDADTSPHVVAEMDKVTLDLQMEILYPDELGTTTIVHQLIEEMWGAAQEAIMVLGRAWADEAIDYGILAGASDFHQGAAFGKAAVDTHAGAGAWDNDVARKRYTQPPTYLDGEEVVIQPEAFEPPTDDADDMSVVWESIKRNTRYGFDAS